MKQATVKFLLYSGIAAAVLGFGFMAAVMLLCWLTPSITVHNISTEKLSNIEIILPSNTLHFDALAPGESADIFYDAKQQDGSYHVSLHRGSTLLSLQCGTVTSGEWRKRMVIQVDNKHGIECKETRRY